MDSEMADGIDRASDLLDELLGGLTDFRSKLETRNNMTPSAPRKRELAGKERERQNAEADKRCTTAWMC